MKKCMIVFWVVCLGLWVIPFPGFSEDGAAHAGIGTAKDPYVIPEIMEKIKVDGKLDEAVWQNTLKLDLPYETWPTENAPAPVKTECYMAYDQSYLYIGARAYDPDPSQIRAFFFERDKIIFDDMIVVFLDTFNDERRAYGFRTNPMGVQFDDIRDRLGTSLAWDAIYASAGHIYDWGYSVEMAIPFNQLRFQHSKEEQVWGFNVRRILPRNMLVHLDHIKIDRSNFCLMCQYVKIKGFKGVSPSRNLEVVPALTAIRTDTRQGMPDGDFEKTTSEVEPGVNVRWGITQNMILNGTVNPDFSQVEADALKLDINEPFALSYEERRPFFYEGADYFNTNFSAIYTRTMRDPKWGLKLTGKAGKSTIGAYVIEDDMTNLILPGSFGSRNYSLAGASNFSSVFRYKNDLGKNNNLGVMVTSREGDAYFNRMAGIDGDFRLTKKDRVQFQFLGSSTQYPDEVTGNPQLGQPDDQFGGSALDLRYSHDARNLDFSVVFQNLTDGFRADLGFMPQVDFRRAEIGTGYTWYGRRGAWFREMTLTGAYNYSETQEGLSINNGANLKLNYKGPLQSYITLTAAAYREMYNLVEFDLVNFSLSINFKPSGHLELSLASNFGDRIDYANTRPGDRVRLNPIISYKPGRHTLIELAHIYERLNIEAGRLYTANISYLGLAYHFNIRTFFRAILQYIDYDYNAGLYTFPIAAEIKKLATQFLFSYKLNPRTVFFLGYSDNYLGTPLYGLTQSDRTFFAKISYAWSL